ncbi:MAG: siderophore-interacting protein [Pseudonocardiaceae bacterium]
MTAYPYYLATVVRRHRLTPHMIRIGLGGSDLADFARGAADQYVKLLFPAPGHTVPTVPALEDDDVQSWYRRYLALPDAVRPIMRTYTVRKHRPEVHEVDVDFVVHDDAGQAGQWAQRAQLGDHVGIIAARGSYQPPDTADWQLIVGDEAALPAIGAIVESMAPHTRARVWVEVADRAEEQPLVAPPLATVCWLHRGRTPAGRSTVLLNAVRAATLPRGTPYAWVAGEAGMVRALRRHLVAERGIDRAAITFTGYWRLGKTEADEYTAEELAELESA